MRRLIDDEEYFQGFLKKMETKTEEFIRSPDGSPVPSLQRYVKFDALSIDAEKRGGRKEKRAKRQRVEPPPSAATDSEMRGERPRTLDETANMVMQMNPRYKDAVEQRVTDGMRTFMICTSLFYDNPWPVEYKDISNVGAPVPSPDPNDYTRIRVPDVAYIRNKLDEEGGINMHGYHLLLSHYENKIYKVNLTDARAEQFGEVATNFIVNYLIGVPVFLMIPVEEVEALDDSIYALEEIRMQYQWPSIYHNAAEDEDLAMMQEKNSAPQDLYKARLINSTSGRALGTFVELGLFAMAAYFQANDPQ